jgi:hypothetical protein
VRRAAAASALALAAAVAVAGCSAEAANGCNCCCTAAVDASGDTVWVAQGTRLLALDRDTGEIRWSRQVTRRTPSGSEELTDVSASPAGVWVAWRGGAVLVPGPTGRTVRMAVAPRAASPSLATVRGRTWMGAGRRAILLRRGGRPGPVKRFGQGVTVSAGAQYVVVTGRDGARLLLDPATGALVHGSIVSTRPRWRAEPRSEQAVPLDPATGAPVGDPVRLGRLATVTELAGGEAYAVTDDQDLAVTRLDPDAPGGIRWRRAIAPG